MAYPEQFTLPPVDTQTAPLNQEQARNEAFYAAGTYSPNPIEDYDRAYQELTQTGTSPFVETAKNLWKDEQNVANRIIIQDIVTDPSIPAAKKQEILANYAQGGYITSDLKDKYRERVATFETSNIAHEIEAQNQRVLVLPEIIASLDRQSKSENLDKAAEGFWANATNRVGAEALSVTNLVSSLPHFAISLTGTLGYGLAEYMDKRTVDWTAAREAGYKIATENFSLLDWRLDSFAESINLRKEWNESLTNRVFGTIGEGIDWLATKSEEKGIMSKDAAKTLIDAGMFIIPTGYGVAKGIKRKYKGSDSPKTVETIDPDTGKPVLKDTADSSLNTKTDTPYSNTAASNPKAAASMVKDAIVDPTGEFAKVLGENEAGVFVENNLYFKTEKQRGKIENPDLAQEVIRDSNAKEFALQKAAYGEASVVDLAKRSEDLEVINSIVNSHAGYYNQSRSVFFPDIDTIKGTSVFTKDGNYSFHSRTDVIATYESLAERIKSLPENERGSLFIVDDMTKRKYSPESLMADSKFEEASIFAKQFSIEWNFEKKYDLLDSFIHGLDSQTVSVLGVDTTKLARDPLFGSNIFYTGIFPKWFDQGLNNAAMQASHLTTVGLGAIKEKIAKTKLKKELSRLVDQAESAGKEYYSKNDLRALFPKLNEKQVDELYSAHIMWREANNYNWNLANLKHKRDLVAEGYDKFIYKDGAPLKTAGPIKTEISVAGVKDVWDFDLDKAVAFDTYKGDPKTLGSGTYHANSKQIVRLKKPYEAENGVSYNHGLIGERTVIDTLPGNVLPKIPGYSPIRTTGHYFVQVTPKKVMVDGIEYNDKTPGGAAALRNYVQVKGVAKTKYDAQRIVDEFSSGKYKDYKVEFRKAREDRFDDTVTQYELHEEMLANAMQRGERLRTVGGQLAPIEDRLVTLTNTTRALAETTAYESWDRVTKAAFVRDFKEFLEVDRFPVSKTEIIRPSNATEATMMKYKAALAAYNKYATVKMSENMLSKAIGTTFSYVADILEKSSITRIVAPLARDISEAAPSIEAFPRKVATTLFIALNTPMRHYMIQPQTFYEMSLINPATAAKSWRALPHVMLGVLDDSAIHKKYGKAFTKVAHTKLEKALEGIDGMSKQEFDAVVKAIKTSGLRESVDSNLMMSNLFGEASEKLTHSSAIDKVYSKVKEPFSKAVGVVRTAGFTVGEFTNRVGLWLQTKELWQLKNPGKNWNTPENIAQINYDSLVLSGAMIKESSFTYQHIPILNNMTQFDSISHKLTMNLLQDNATILDRGQRAKLTAVRLAMYGAYGTPFGIALFLEEYLRSQPDTASQEISKFLQKGGGIDLAYNSILKGVTDSESSEILFSKALSPYGSEAGGFVYDYISRFTSLATGTPSERGQRFPTTQLFGRIGDTIRDVSTLFQTEPVTVDNLKEMAYTTAQLSSGFSNFTKAQMMLATGDKISKLGKPYGLNATVAEAWGQALGFTTLREVNQFVAINATVDQVTKNKQIAEDLYRAVVRRKENTDRLTYLKALPKYLSLLDGSPHFNKQDIADITNRMMDLDRATHTTNEMGIVKTYYQKHSNTYHENYQILRNALQDSKDPQTKKLLKTLDQIYVKELK